MGTLVTIFHMTKHCLTHCSPYDIKYAEIADTNNFMEGGRAKLRNVSVFHIPATFAYSNGFVKLSYASMLDPLQRVCHQKNFLILKGP